MPPKETKSDGVGDLLVDGPNYSKNNGGSTDKKTEKRETEAKSKLLLEAKRIKDVDLLGLAKEELQTDVEEVLNNMKGKRHAQEPEKKPAEENKAQTEDPGIILAFLQWILAKEKKIWPWSISRREEIEIFISSRSFGIYSAIGIIGGWGSNEKFWYNRIKRKKMEYVGDRDPKTEDREKRGICWWPDPPKGGGECYYGLWRTDKPHDHGMFKWYDGDRYMGMWTDGTMDGYGVYSYSSIGPHPNDTFEGAYHAGLRHGTGVYRYGKGQKGSVYMGEWLMGVMNGAGLMYYHDGEHYMGQWKKDLKHGIGVYFWGPSAGDCAGDKYEGNFKDGTASGSGVTVFSDGGWHKGWYYKGKMHGWGVMRTSDGFEYVGNWNDDEMHGEIMVTFLFALNEEMIIQIYEMGVMTGTRDYDTANDFTQLAAKGIEARMDAEEAAENARKYVAEVTTHAKRAKLSQSLARKAAEEAQYWVKACMKYREFKRKWYGLYQHISIGD